MNRVAPLLSAVVLALLVSGPALAGPRLLPVPETPTRHVRLLTSDGSSSTGRQDASPTGRRLAELGLGAVTGTAVAAAAAVLATAHIAGSPRCIDSIDCTVSGFLGAFVGFNLGASLGTYVAGELLGGHGGYVGPLIGTVAGTTVGLGLSILFGSTFNAPEEVLLLVPALGLAGALIGYELSQTPPTRRLRPLLSVSSRGGLVGLAGAF